MIFKRRELTSLLIFAFFILISQDSFAQYQNNQPEVFVFTDINLGGGDPDDRQSLIHSGTFLTAWGNE